MSQLDDLLNRSRAPGTLVERRRFVIIKHLLPEHIGPLRRIERTVLLPLFKAIIVRDDRAIESTFEICLRMRRTEEMRAGPDLAQGIKSLAVLGHIDATQHDAQNTGLVGVHYEFLVAHDEPAFEPTGGVQHEIYARKRRGL